MIIWVVLSIIILYFLFAFLNTPIKKVIGRKICAICAAVSITWGFLLLLKLLGLKIDVLVIAILMGQSLVGLIAKLEEYFKGRGLKKFWLVRIFVITGGTLFIYWLLKEEYFLLFFLLLGGVFISPVIFSMISKEKPVVLEGSKDYQKAVLRLEKMMEECC